MPHLQKIYQIFSQKQNNNETLIKYRKLLLSTHRYIKTLRENMMKRTLTRTLKLSAIALILCPSFCTSVITASNINAIDIDAAQKTKVYSDADVKQVINNLNDDLSEISKSTNSDSDTDLKPLSPMYKNNTDNILNTIGAAASWATAAFADSTKESWKAGKGLAFKESMTGLAKLLDFGKLFGPLVKLFMGFGCPGEESPEMKAINDLKNTLNYFQEQTAAHFKTTNRKIDLNTITPLVQEQITMQQNFRTANGGTDALTGELNAKKYFTGENTNETTFDYNTKAIYHTIGDCKVENNTVSFSQDKNTTFVGDVQKLGNALTSRTLQNKSYDSFNLYAAYVSLARELNFATFSDREKWNETIKDDWAYLTQVATLGIYADATRCQAISIAFDRLTHNDAFWQDKTSAVETKLRKDLAAYSDIKKQDETKDLNLFGLTVTHIDTNSNDYTRTYGPITAAERNTTTPLTELSQKIEQNYNNNQKEFDQEKSLSNQGTYYDYAAATSFTTNNSCPLYRAVLGSAGGKDAQIKKQGGTTNHWGVANLMGRHGLVDVLEPVASLDHSPLEAQDNDPQGYDMSNALSSQQLANMMTGLDAKGQSLEQFCPEIKGRPVYANNFNPETDDHGVSSGFMYWEGYDLDANYYRGTKLDPNQKIKHAFYEYYSFLNSSGVGSRYLPTEWQHTKQAVTILKAGKPMNPSYLIQ